MTQNLRVEPPALTFSCTRRAVQSLTATSAGGVEAPQVLRGNDIEVTSAMERGSDVGRYSWEGPFKRGWSCHIVLWKMPTDQLGWCDFFLEAWVAGTVCGERAGDSL